MHRIEPSLIEKQLLSEIQSMNEARIELDDITSNMKRLNDNELSRNQSIQDSQLSKETTMAINSMISSLKNNLQNSVDKYLATKHYTDQDLCRLMSVFNLDRVSEISVIKLLDTVDLFSKKNEDEIHDSDMLWTFKDNDPEYNCTQKRIPIVKLTDSIGKAIATDWYIERKIRDNKEINEYLQKKLNVYKRKPDTKLRYHLARRLGVKIGDILDEVEIHKIGSYILNGIIESCKIYNKKTDQEESAFKHAHVYGAAVLQGVIKCHNGIYELLKNRTKFKAPKEIPPKSKPMIIPPRPWKNTSEGPYFYYNENLMRFNSFNRQYKILRKSTINCELNTFYGSLNIMQNVSWKINKRVLDVMEYIYNIENGNIAKLPSKIDIELPIKPNKNEYNSDSEYKNAMNNYDYKWKSITKKNREMHSLRCDFNLKINLAKELLQLNALYFPLNIDFRGRIYPISPHISHIGSDICRGILMFSKGKPLGSKGFYWQKVNLANKFGYDKVSNDKRCEWTENNWDNIINCGNDPIKHKWWLTADSPWQALSIIFELNDIYNCDNINEYISCIGVGQDGSCNGLQHYAGMLRDTKMAENVNVASRDKRGDIYTVVKDYVNELINQDYNTTNDKNIKQMSSKIKDKITRKMIKQTVMTSVYGVTDYGAKAQVKKWLLDAINSNNLDGFNLNTKDGILEIAKISSYIATHTTNAIGKANTPAYLTMLWLRDCASLIALHGHFVSWKTPLNLPCTQHYSKDRFIRVTGKFQEILLADNENTKTNKFKQSNAFPPNLVHSLDSTHCLMTANLCYNKIINNNNDRLKITFASIHDSFWTHASDVDTMNQIIRECFIELHNKPILYDLYQTLKVLHPNIQFCEPPKQGNFQLNEVKQSEFFFS